MTPYSDLKVTDREGNLLEENRPEPQDAIRADTAYMHDHPAPRRRRARHRGEGRGAGLADRRQDRHDRRFQRRVVHRLRSGHHAGVWVGYDQKKPLGAGHDRRRSRAADLDRDLEVLDRRPQGPADLRAPGNIVFVSVDKARASRPSIDTPGSIREAFIAGTQPGPITPALHIADCRLQIGDWRSRMADSQFNRQSALANRRSVGLFVRGGGERPRRPSSSDTP